MYWYTADWHLNDPRIQAGDGLNPLLRPFQTPHEMNMAIQQGIFNSGFADGDVLFHLGDVAYVWDEEVALFFEAFKERYPNSKIELVMGELDEDKVPQLEPHFTYLHQSHRPGHQPPELVASLTIDGLKVVLNHFPSIALDEIQTGRAHRGLVGHVHGTWRFTRDLINVGVDAWNYAPVPQTHISDMLLLMRKTNWEAFPYERDRGPVFKGIV